MPLNKGRSRKKVSSVVKIILSQIPMAHLSERVSSLFSIHNRNKVLHYSTIDKEMKTNRSSFKKLKGLPMLFGILLLTLGLLILLSQLVNQNVWALFGLYWPILLVIYGTYRLATKKGSRVVSAVIIGSGALIQLKNLGLIRGSAFLILFAAGLVLLGIKIIVEDHQDKEAFRNRQAQAYTKTPPTGEGESDESRQAGGHSKRPNFYEEKDVLNDRFLFVNDTKVYRSDTFSGGQVEASFSDVILDLKNVWPLENEIYMDVQVNFSTLTLQLPTDWHVIVNDKHYYSAKELKDQVEPEITLIIRSREFMGSLKII